jgi:class 3 adenylate cyclase
MLTVFRAGTKWRMDSIEEWLASLGLVELSERFRANDIDLSVLPHLSDMDLEKIGLSLGHRRKILHAISQLAGDRSVSRPPSAADDADHADQMVQQQLTVLCCRLADADSHAKRLDPEAMRMLMKGVQLTCGGVIRAYNGFLARLLPDGLIALFGYPQVEPDDAERAVRAALEICAGVEMLESNAGAPVTVQIGIASGTVDLGLSSGQACLRDQTFEGQIPALARRLQALAAPGAIVMARPTHELIGTRFEVRELGYYEVKSLAP